MNYPIWDLGSFTGGQLIALISILHVYIAHLAVGGGLFIWLTDRKAVRENDENVLGYVRKHTKFFLLLTMVFGGVTGVGIWFIIGLVNPVGTSALIHNFVFGWAIEWVFFVGEIVALLIYYYKFDKMSTKSRLTIAFFYFFFAWLSLFIINGILSFMLTPGAWLDNQQFWSGFFNPTFFPSLIFRSAMAFMIAGLFGILTTVFLAKSDFRDKMLRYSGKWILYPVIVLVLSAYWYYASIPDFAFTTNFELNSEMATTLMVFVVFSIAVVILGAYFLVKSAKPVQIFIAFVLIISGLMWMGGFEYSREYARKPFVVSDFIYSNSIYKANLEKYNEDGFLTNAKWVNVSEVTDENLNEAGEELFKQQCSACHTIGGTRNDILPRTEMFTMNGMMSQLTGQGKVLTYMPPFVGNEREKEALAAFIVNKLHNKSTDMSLPSYDIDEFEYEVPQFDIANDEYVLLVWNDLGMHCISDSDPWFVILPPANTLEAQLIKRGEQPQIIKDGVEIVYEVEEQHKNPAKHVEFWKYAKTIFGADLEPNVGLQGHGMSGKFEFNPDVNSFQVHAIPVVPYRDDGKYNPYPMFDVKAIDKATGETLIATKVVAPTSTEMGCINCHGGEWRVPGVSGVSDETAINILKAHDKNEGTTLYQDALNGKPKMCASCHPDAATGMEGQPGHMSLSASLHSWHANYMHAEGGDACMMCHPANPEGNTRCSRGIHNTFGMTCVNCHGEMEEHAMGLLKAQDNKERAEWMIRNLNSVNVPNHEEIVPRKAWLNQPECTNCHVDFEQPEVFPAFNEWVDYPELFRIRTDPAGMRCEACHNSPHAIYPATNAIISNMDNVQPMQYNKNIFPIGSEDNCELCHKTDMPFSIHHPNMKRPFRNKFFFEEVIQAMNSNGEE